MACVKSLKYKALQPKTPRVGLEPTSEIQQSIENKELTENSNPVLATSLDKILQKYPELGELIKVWPKLPEQARTEVKNLIEKHSTQAKEDGTE